MWEAQAVDIALTIELLRYYAGWTTKIEGKVLPNSIPGMFTVAKREPVGVVAAITPWNFPLLEVGYKLGPALAAGLHDRDQAVGAGAALDAAADAAGRRGGVPARRRERRDRRPRGRRRARAASRACRRSRSPDRPPRARRSCGRAVDGLKRVTLELGGKSPNIVFADADLDAAASGAFGGIFFNQGQACVAGSRLFVRGAGRRGARRTGSRSRRRGIRLGSRPRPRDPDGAADLGERTARGSAATSTRRASRAPRSPSGGDEASVAGLRGRVLPGAHRDQRRAQRHEGRAGGDLRAGAVGDPVRRTRRSCSRSRTAIDYGLASGIWTSDVSKALRVADRLDAGTVWINTYGMFDVAVPFGGRKHSGFGKELGEEALEPYLHSKSVWVDLTVGGARSRGRASRGSEGEGMTMSDRIIIKNGTVVTMNDADDVIFGGTVVIEDDRITDVGPAADVAGRTDESGATVIDATDKAVMPGLVDLHYHTAARQGLERPPAALGVPGDVLVSDHPRAEPGGGVLGRARELQRVDQVRRHHRQRHVPPARRAREGRRGDRDPRGAVQRRRRRRARPGHARGQQARLRAVERRGERPDRGLHRDRVAAARLRGPAEGRPRRSPTT